VTHDGRTLLLLVVDGRRAGWSVGVTLPQLGRIMLEAGAWNAVNLDGGGSSAMWYRAPGEASGRVLNRPSDGRVRPVATHLGVRVGRDAPPRGPR
jgi:exopolysaccharide biosynthesis protein